jgi:hypothetical protein
VDGVAFPGKRAVEELVAEGADGPDVAFLGVDVGVHGFGGHVEGCAYIIVILGAFSGFLHHSEICDFDLVAFEEDIGGFEVAVEVPGVQETGVCWVELGEKCNQLILSVFAFYFEMVFEIASIAVLCDYIAIM